MMNGAARIWSGRPVTAALVGVNLALFVLTLLLGGDLLGTNGRVQFALGSNFGPVTLSGQWWRLLSCQFLHFGLIHIAFNASALWSIGPIAERWFGRWHFLLLYLLAGIGGGFGTLLWRPEVNSAGASGAIFGIIGGLLAFLSRRQLGVPAHALDALRRYFLGFAAISLAFGFLLPGVDNAAHVGGLATGFLVGLLLARPLGAARRAGPDALRLAGVAAAALISFAALAASLQRGP